MSSLGRILIADDEETFARSTADLLSREGFVCETVADAPAAAAALHREAFDLLIADIRMPGNGDLQLLRAIEQIDDQLSVIIVTGYPTLDTAIDAIDLHVIQYLKKPFAFETLLLHARRAVARTRTLRTARSLGSRLQECRDTLTAMEQDLGASRGQLGADQILAFIDLNVRNILGSVADLRQLAEVLATDAPGESACRLMNCPRERTLNDALLDTIGVLEQTKHQFKSDELGQLRLRLAELIRKR